MPETPPDDPPSDAPPDAPDDPSQGGPPHNAQPDDHESGDQQPELPREERLAMLRQEHRTLDETIARLSEAGPINQLEVQRLKRRKLQLRDQIARLESGRYPDIIA